MEVRKVDSFDLSNLIDKAAYEAIINKYPTVKEEFSYMRDGTPKVTVWYISDED